MKRITAALVFALASTGWAQQTDTTVYRVGEIIVRATRPVTTTGGASALELKLDSLRMAAAPTLDQILRQIPLMQVRVNSRGESQFSLRGSGSDARQVAVIVDGIPLNFGWDDRADLSVIPATAAQTLTVARGLPSLLYGPNVLGGVVEIGVARGSSELNPRGVRFDAGADHTGATGLATSITLPMQNGTTKWLLRAGAGHRQRDGFALPQDIDEPVPTDDLRLNTDLQHFDGFASLSYRPSSGAWADISVSAYKAERGIAPEMHIASPRFWRYPDASRVFGVVAAGTGHRASPFGGIGDVELSVGADLGHTEIDQFGSSAYDSIAAEEDSDDSNVTLRLRADQTIARNGELRAGFTYTDINHDEVLNPGIPSSYRQQLWSGALELHWDAQRLAAGTRFSVGAALDGASTPESGDKPPLASLTAVGARGGFTTALSPRAIVHGGISIRSRFPSLRELYSGALGRFEPNPNLQPERLLALEAGASFSFGRADLQVVGFHHALEDAIVRISVPNQRFMRVNRDRQLGTGVELLTGVRLGEMSLSGDVVIQRTELTDESTGVASEPEYQPDVIAGLGLAGPLPLSARFDLRARHTGRQSCINPDSGVQTGIPSAQRYDAEVSRAWTLRGAWTSAIELAVGADNLSDEVIYDQCGLPQPGRTFRIQLRVR
ncbi:MAG TPA: TonB-dependent receptor [Longimicrobiales bacterium]